MAVSDSTVRINPAALFPTFTYQKDNGRVEDAALLVQKLTQTTSDLIYIYDFETEQVVYSNRSLGALLGHNTQSGNNDDTAMAQVLLHLDDLDRVNAQLATMQAAPDCEVMEIQYRLKHASGDWRWFSENQMVYKRNPNGTVAQILKVAHDITDQQEAALHLQNDNLSKIAELEQAAAKIASEHEKMQLLSAFIGHTAHELRTPLTIINTSLYLLKKMSDPVKQAERFQIIENQVAQLTRLVSQMHFIMRLDSLTPPLPCTPVSLNMLLTKLEQDFGGAIAKKELILELTFADDLPTVYGDIDLILSALRNVIENAIQYTDTGVIKAQTVRNRNRIVVSITDSGIGIDPLDIEHIFERFYKVEKDKKNSRVAAGLGLAITKRIMELHGGDVTVESELGHGSTFHLAWPL